MIDGFARFFKLKKKYSIHTNIYLRNLDGDLNECRYVPYLREKYLRI